MLYRMDGGDSGLGRVGRLMDEEGGWVKRMEGRGWRDGRWTLERVGRGMNGVRMDEKGWVGRWMKGREG